MAERMSLAHNLHDGMGATLVNNIAALEHGGQAIPSGALPVDPQGIAGRIAPCHRHDHVAPYPADRPLAEWLAPAFARASRSYASIRVYRAAGSSTNWANMPSPPRRVSTSCGSCRKD